MSDEQREAAHFAITHSKSDGEALDALVDMWDSAVVDPRVACLEAAKYALRAGGLEYPGKEAVEAMGREIFDVLWPVRD